MKFIIATMVVFMVATPILATSIPDLFTKYSTQYGISEQLIKKVANCESSFSPKAINHSDNSQGLMQFQPQTFYTYAKKISIANPSIWNADQQVHVAAYMFSIGQGKQWTTYRAIQNGGSYTFYSKQLKKWITVYCK